jgi:hypothetical protein
MFCKNGAVLGIGMFSAGGPSIGKKLLRLDALELGDCGDNIAGDEGTLSASDDCLRARLGIALTGSGKVDDDPFALLLAVETEMSICGEGYAEADAMNPEAETIPICLVLFTGGSGLLNPCDVEGRDAEAGPSSVFSLPIDIFFKKPHFLPSFFSVSRVFTVVSGRISAGCVALSGRKTDVTVRGRLVVGRGGLSTSASASSSKV